MTVDALQELACEAMEYKESMSNLTSINLTLSWSLTEAQETMLVLSKQLQVLQSQSKAKKPTTNKLAMEKKTRVKKSKSY